MDPLSIAASLSGLIATGVRITSLVQRLLDAPRIALSVEAEISHFVVILSQLQPLLTDSPSLIDAQQIDIILNGSVLTLTELQAAMAGICQGSTGIGIRDRVRWLLAESTIAELIQRVRDHKSSLTLILTLQTWYESFSPSLFEY